MKPLGIALSISGQGPMLRVSHPTQSEDAIWGAVDTAIAEGWTPARFRQECAMAWKQVLLDEAKAAARELLR